MRILNLRLSEEDCKKYEISSDNMSFDNFLNKIKNTIAKEAIEKCHLVARESGLDKITSDEINAEIEAVRNAKGNN
jgi:hypothetical protein